MAPGGGDGVGRNHAALLPTMGAFLEEVWTRIADARRRVYVECFTVRPDSLGRRLLEALADASARGGDARLLYDPGGSNDVSESFWEEFRRRGVAIRPYGQAAFLGLLRPGVHDHARVVLVDGAALTGGHAWAEEWLPREQGGRGWRDLNCSVVGPIVDEWAALFERRWRAAASSRIVQLDTADRYPDVRLISDGPGRRRGIIEAYLEAFRRARRRIWLGNAYFFPTIRFKRALYKAVRRGVDVRIVMPRDSDLPTISRAARSACAAWLRRGLGVYEYQDGMFHAKYGLVDDDWCTIGSYNALGTATTVTVETNLIVRDPSVVADVARRFREDLGQSRRVERSALANRSLFTRLVDFAAWLALSAANRITGGAGNYLSGPGRNLLGRGANQRGRRG